MLSSANATAAGCLERGTSVFNFTEYPQLSALFEELSSGSDTCRFWWYVGNLDCLQIFTYAAILEVMYRVFSVLIPLAANSPGLSPKNRATLCRCGPSYAVGTLVTGILAFRGAMHVFGLADSPAPAQMCIAQQDLATWSGASAGELSPPASAWSAAHREVVLSNQLFLAYMAYDLLHVLCAFPALGKMDTVLHHAGFLGASIINGYYGVLPFPFGWLIFGEVSTPLLNLRWLLINTGRGKSWLMDWTNKLFALLFLATRIGVYGWGLVRMVHSRHAMFRAEVGSSCHSALMPVPARTVALSLVVFGFCLNCFWAMSIVNMALGRGGKGRKPPPQQLGDEAKTK